MTKFNFKTFNQNASALAVPPSVQSLFRELIETLNFHSSIIETLATAAEDSLGQEFSKFRDESDFKPFMDDVDHVLHAEIFGGV